MKRAPTSLRPGVSRGRVETLRRMISTFSMANGRVPTDEELARLLATSVVHVRRALTRISKERS